MIKDLIQDLTFDKITLTQALTRAKLIAYKIKNDNFKEWIELELGGYINKELPKYRVINCDVFAEVIDPFRGKYTIPFDVTNVDKDLTENSFYKMNVTQSVGTMESGLEKDGESQYGYEFLPQQLVQLLRSMTSDGDSITAVKRRIQFSEIRHILSITKQKLLDILLQLNDAFPHLENDFVTDINSIDKAQTIINHNIYGNYSNSNIGIGQNVSQSINNENKIEELVKELSSMGVEDEDIAEIRTIIQNKNKESIPKQVMNWLGKLSTKVIEKGIELNIPLILERLQEFI